MAETITAHNSKRLAKNTLLLYVRTLIVMAISLFTSRVILDSLGVEDYGTYNFADSRRDPVGHFYNDVLPWLLWGNDGKDSTQMRQRLRALVIDGGIEAAQSRVKKEPGEP